MIKEFFALHVCQIFIQNFLMLKMAPDLSSFFLPLAWLDMWIIFICYSSIKNQIYSLTRFLLLRSSLCTSLFKLNCVIYLSLRGVWNTLGHTWTKKLMELSFDVYKTSNYLDRWPHLRMFSIKIQKMLMVKVRSNIEVFKKQFRIIKCLCG